MSTLCLAEGCHSKVGRSQVKKVFRVRTPAQSCQTLQPHRLQTRLLCPWDFPDKNTRGVFRDPEIEPGSPELQVGALSLSHPVKEWVTFCFVWPLGLLCSWLTSAQRPHRHHTQQKLCSYSDMTQGPFLLSNAIYSFHFSFYLYKQFRGNFKLPGPNCRPGAIGTLFSCA